MRRTRPTQDITRHDAAVILNSLLMSLDAWSRDSKTDRGDILAQLFDLVNRFDLQVPHPCSGEAHSNPYIDNCGVCMPHWGSVHRDVKVR